ITPHPNSQTVKSFDQRIAEAKSSVRNTWNDLYKNQQNQFKTQAEKNFKANKGLPEDFLVKLEGVKPGQELDVEYLEAYQRFSKKQFKSLVDAVDAQWFEEFERVSPNATVAEREAAKAAARGKREYRVEWPEQKKIQQTFDWSQKPSTQQVR